MAAKRKLDAAPDAPQEKYIEAKEGDIMGEGFDGEGWFVFRLKNGEKVKERVAQLIADVSQVQPHEKETR